MTDANTGARLTGVSTDGLDTAAAIEHARTVGQQALGELTIHERALKLKELAIYLQDHREELYELANQAGANKRDNFVDIDGGISTMFTFSSKGRREMPNSTVMPDGEAEVFSKDGSFIGRHIYTSIPGVAVQINAFNFPVWGMLEKFAPAFIAGVPSIVKPATPTGYITAACVRLMIDSGILPEGSLQLISGSARDLLDHLDYRDHVAFTGSAATAATLKKHPNVQEGGVRFTAETDSLNAAILGPDAAPGTPEFEAFVKVVFQEMTVKAGQKCTAIRRVIVPQEHVDAVVEALAAGRLHGYGTDVTDPEPLPDGHPLWTEERALITPHTADTPEMCVPLLHARVERNLRARAAGTELEGLVDAEGGY